MSNSVRFSCIVSGAPCVLGTEDIKNLKLAGIEVTVGEIVTTGSQGKAPKEQKSYTAFSLKGSDWEVKSVPSKNGNPDAVLRYTGGKDVTRNSLLKMFGWKWDPSNICWHNANSDEAKKVFTFKAEDIFTK